MEECILLKTTQDIDTLINRFKKKDKVALAKLITIIENEPDKAHEIFQHFEGISHDSYIVGITGSPGVGKSTLTSEISKKLLEEGKSVGIICVDPTSPFSGGAFLGDRVRMTDISLHPNVFLRSLASRGYKGGISRAVFDISLLYEAYGMDLIIIETVGVGQAEFDIYNLAYSVVVILVPGYGDAIQMQKAGIIEIGDIYDINKKDLGGEDIAVQIEMMLDDSTFQSGWRPPVSMTNAISGEGVEDLVQNIMDHKEHLELSESIDEKKKNRFRYKIKELVYSKIDKIISESFLNEKEINEIIKHALGDGKFKIYRAIHNKFEDVNFEIKKR
ncbi:MAG: methylmalonyl Co-A mutase-associated GTPase MeaB [Promethearchaeota archaeon Loki_b32]|nr:MAG: methylmalonyl Co-A mutase-associated GTPase MeaB [Candidatus Lokiarchaeota archaeon Loki_b32]